jgi:hypothetical protein
MFFIKIDTSQLVNCCSVIYKDDYNFAKESIGYFIILFYMLFFAALMLVWRDKKGMLFIWSAFFAYIAYLSVIYFFGTYIYELPTHNCPFCMMQKEYGYVGYFVWISYFLMIFYATLPFLIKQITHQDRSYKIEFTLFLSVFVLLCTYFVVRYYLINHTFL